MLEISGVTIKSGERKRIKIPIARLFDYTEMSMPIEVVCGRKEGPTLFVSAAIHGDEINGVDIIKRLLASRRIGPTMRGTLIAIPIVNVFGFNRNTRYLPDRRDLNRCFPGFEGGSMGAQFAHLFMREIVQKSTHGIDLHTGAVHRSNLPHIRACLDNPETKRLAHAFGVSVAIDSAIRDGSLRQAANEKGIPMLLFEGGEALRFEETVIQTGLKGIFSVMESIGMLSAKMHLMPKKDVYVAHSSHWMRAPQSGCLRFKRKIGDRVKEGDLLGEITNPYGDEKLNVRTTKSGIIIGKTMIPLVNKGDALFHIATFEDASNVSESLVAYEENLGEFGGLA